MPDFCPTCNKFAHLEVAICDIDSDRDQPDRDIDSLPSDLDKSAKAL